jgi:hypothetical protein
MDETLESVKAERDDLRRRLDAIREAYPEHCRRSGGMIATDWPEMESALDEFESVLFDKSAIEATKGGD